AIDKATVSGSLAPSGAEFLRASLSLALGPNAPPISTLMLQTVRSYKPDKPHEFQSATVGTKSSTIVIHLPPVRPRSRSSRRGAGRTSPACRRSGAGKAARRPWQTKEE
ncbi:hypothetical protein V8E36_000197, partial [Tilletia maclaganii]